MKTFTGRRLIAAVLLILVSYMAGTEGTALVNFGVSNRQASIVSIDVCGHGGYSINQAGLGAALFQDLSYRYYPVSLGFPPAPDETSAEALPGETYKPPEA